MFIQTETTPNPEVIKFLPGQAVSPMQNYDFKTSDEAEISPLASRIFTLDGVNSVFLGSDFISVGKDEALEWVMLKPRILAAILDHFTSGAPVINGDDAASKENLQKKTAADFGVTGDEAHIVDTILELLATRIRPAVAQDGGDIIFHRYDQGIVYLEMHGACAGCPSSTVTLKAGIENMLRHYIPEVTEVRQAA
jgi:Fe-S cluster biogenesis protein NfuA